MRKTRELPVAKDKFETFFLFGYITGKTPAKGKAAAQEVAQDFRNRNYFARVLPVSPVKSETKFGVWIKKKRE